MGLDHHYEDFGKTLGRYGVGAGAYVVLPVLGPSTVRDAAALPVDRLATPPAFFNGTKTQIGLTVLQIVNKRSSLLGATRVIDDIALDKYTFIRDAYLQRRGSLVFDSDAPQAPSAPDDAGSDAAGTEGASGSPAAAVPAAAPPSAPASGPARPGSAPAR
jgi:phospholipid-binding lipoprotein MlaA